MLIGCLFCSKVSLAQSGMLYTDDLVFGDILVNGSANPTLHSGDSVTFTVTVRNAGASPFQNCQLTVTTLDPYVTLLDSTEYFDYIAPGNEYTLHECATCVLNPNIPDGHFITFSFLITNNTESALIYRSYRIQGCLLSVVEYSVIDNGNHDGLVNLAETDTLLFTLRNVESRALYNLDFSLTTTEPGIQVISSPMAKDTLLGEETFLFAAVVNATSPFVDGTTFDVSINVASTNGQGGSTPIGSYVVSIVGIANCENFSDGIYPLKMYGDTAWTDWRIDSLDAHSGQYSLCSGAITHNDTSVVHLPVTINFNSYITFAYKTSSENNYDWLYFFIDGVQKGRWSGTHDWTEISYAVQPGNHILTWKYTKDYSVSSGSDCVWIDDICLSNYNDGYPSLAVTPDSIDIVFAENDAPVFERSLHFFNESDIYLLFENELHDAQHQPVAWVNVVPTNGSLNAHQQRDITLRFNTTGYYSGDYAAALFVHVCDMDTVIRIPIVLHNHVAVEDRGPVGEEALPVTYFPNPTTGLVKVSHETNAFRQVLVTDIYGRMLQVLPCKGLECQVDLSGLPRGLYLLNLTFENGNKTSVKVVKE